MVTILEHLKPTLKIVEFYYVGKSAVYALITDSDGANHFVGEISPAGELSFKVLARKHGVSDSVFYRHFSSQKEFEEFVKAHDYLSKTPLPKGKPETGAQGKTPMST